MKAWCYACEELHPVALFTKDKKRSNGLSYVCKPIRNTKRKESDDKRRAEGKRSESAQSAFLTKQKVIYEYSNGTNVCVSCGFKDIRALTIDHINGDGSIERKLLGNKGRGSHFYIYLKINNFPKGYQVLCMNCQFIKRHNNKEYT